MASSTWSTASSSHRRRNSAPIRRTLPLRAGGFARRVTASTVGEAVDETEGLPPFVDRAALVVDEAVCEADLLHRLEGQVALDLRRLLRPRDPEPVGRVEGLLERREAPLELRARRREVDDDADSRLRAELLGERRPGVVLTGGHATRRGARPRVPGPALPPRSSPLARALRGRSPRAA